MSFTPLFPFKHEPCRCWSVYVGVNHFEYLSAIICDEGSIREVLSRTAETTAALARLKTIWKDKNIIIKHKIRLMRALVITTFLYACDTWTLTANYTGEYNR